MTNATLIKYAEIVKAEKELAEKKEVLKAKIVEDFGKDKIDKLECDFGTFTISSKPKWEYSKKVKKLESDLKILKVTEQENETAKKTDGDKYVVFTAPKDK